MVVQRDWPEFPHNLFDGTFRKVHSYHMHFPAHRTIAFHIRRTSLAVTELIRVDAVLLAMTECLAHAIGSVPFAHDLIEDPVEVGVSVELVTSHD